MSVEAVSFKESVKKSEEQLQALKATISGFVPAEQLVDWHVPRPMETYYRGEPSEKERMVIINDRNDQRATVRLQPAYGKNTLPWGDLGDGVDLPVTTVPSVAALRGMLVAILSQAKCSADVSVATAFAKAFEYLTAQGWIVRYCNLGMDKTMTSLDLALSDAEHDIVMSLYFTTVRKDSTKLELSFPFYTTQGFWCGEHPNGPSAHVVGFINGEWHDLATLNNWVGGDDSQFVSQPIGDDMLETLIPMISEDSVMSKELFLELVEGLRKNIPGLEYNYISHSVTLGGAKATINGRSQIDGVKRQYSIHFKTGV